jgi:UDPglucose--hexose-1-phosphate uridylyltransferase
MVLILLKMNLLMLECREKRWHPLFQEWVIIAESTSNRPWNGEVTHHSHESSLQYDENCYLCQGNTRANGAVNPNDNQAFSFINDFSSFSFEYETGNNAIPPYSSLQQAGGICKVLVYGGDHSKTLTHFNEEALINVINLWQTEFENLCNLSAIQYILIFENKGKIIGVSSPHPHGQLYATDFVPAQIAQMANSFSTCFEDKGEHLLYEITKFELNQKLRIVCENNDWVVFVPYFAQYAYETFLVSKRFFQHIGHITLAEKKNLAQILMEINGKYDRLFGFQLPNITTIYNAPLTNNQKFKANHFQFFIRFTPPLRAPDKLKYLAGFETGGGNIINPLAPEKAAAILKGC